MMVVEKPQKGLDIEYIMSVNVWLGATKPFGFALVAIKDTSVVLRKTAREVV